MEKERRYSIRIPQADILEDYCSKQGIRVAEFIRAATEQVLAQQQYTGTARRNLSEEEWRLIEQSQEPNLTEEEWQVVEQSQVPHLTENDWQLLQRNSRK